jgi:sec-independent protein translocase protein TatB
MLEVGWSEILVIAMVLIIVVGPKDLPGMLRNFGRMATRVRSMANDFKGQFDQAMREAELEDVSKTIGDVRKLNPTNSLRDAINPLRQLGQDIKTDLQKASDFNAKPVTDQGTKIDDLIADPAAPAKPETTVSALPPAAAMPVIDPAALNAKSKTSRKKAAIDAKADATQPVAVERAEGTVAKTPKKPNTKKASVKTEAAADPFPPPARKVVARRAAEKHVEHNVHVVTPDAAASKEPAKKPARKKTVKTGEA